MIKKGDKGGLQNYKLFYKPVSGDRGKRWNIQKLKRPPAHYVLGKPVRVHAWGNRVLWAVVSKFSKSTKETK